jgi:hypothetical protein
MRHAGTITKDKVINRPGRPKGSLNKITRTMKDAIVAAAEELGHIDFDKWREHLKGDPKNGMKQFFKALAVNEMRTFGRRPRLQRLDPGRLPARAQYAVRQAGRARGQRLRGDRSGAARGDPVRRSSRKYPMTANGSKNRCMTSLLAIGCRIGRRSRCVMGHVFHLSGPELRSVA